MLTASESQRYDRQIRVWGAEAQFRIQSAKVLLCGMRGLNIEVAKNIVLAGVNVVIQDSTLLQPSDLSYAFCCNEQHIGMQFAESVKPSIQLLNKFATVDVETRPLEDLPDEYFKQFTAILLAQCTDKQALRINAICRDSKKLSNAAADDDDDEIPPPSKIQKLSSNTAATSAATAAAATLQGNPKSSTNDNIIFFLSGVFGEEGWFISDFGANFQYKIDPSTTTTNTTNTATATASTNQSLLVSLPQSSSSSSDSNHQQQQSSAGAVESIDISSSTDDDVVVTSAAAEATTAAEAAVISATAAVTSPTAAVTSATAAVPVSPNDIIHTVSFPSLLSVLSQRFSDISKQSKHFPLSATFVKSRLLQIYKERHSGSSPTSNDYDQFEKLAAEVFHDNQVDMHSVVSPQDLKTLTQLNNSILITTTSILGSFLSQEVIKGISKCGIPGYNVFVYSNNDFICKAVPIGTV